MTSFFSDVVHAVRVLLKAPALTIVAALSLALGIGANTTIFSFVNAALLNPLPLEDSSSLVSVWTTDERNPGGYMSSSWPNYVDYRDKGQVFEGLAAQTGVSLNLVGGTGEPQRVQGELVSGNYFSVLHVTPLLGRVFLPEEDRTPGASFVAVLTYNLWQTRFGGDRLIVGQTVTLNNQPFTVIGVMPQGFRGTNLIGGPTLWVPYMSYPVTTSGLVREGIDKRRYLLFNITGRLKPGVNVAQAGANVRTIGRQLEQEYQNDNRGRGAALVPLGTLDPRARANIMTSVGLLITVVGLVLFIACANVASLLLSRAAARQKEIAIRLSLGASRLRLVRQLMTEGLVLAGLGGALGLLLAQWAQRVLWAYRPPFFQADAIDPSVNLRVLLFTIAVSLLTAILFGLVPALQASRPDLVRELKDKGGPTSGASRTFTARNLFISAQVALSLIALVGAGLFVRSLQNAQRISPGFDADHLAVLTFDVGAQGYGEGQGREFQRQMLERVSAIPGVTSATLSANVPLFQGGFSRSVFLEGQDASDARNGRLVPISIVTDRYFDTIGLSLRSGRGFVETDLPNTPRVVIINETMAKLYWPGEEAVGKRFRFFGQDLSTVIGVARDSKYFGVGEDPLPFVYQPASQVYQPNMALIVRSDRPDAVVGLMRGEVQQMAPRMPLTTVMTYPEIFKQSLWAPRMAASLLGVLGTLSLVLAVIGIYGVMAYSVSQRTRELGLRMALGADWQAVLWLVVSQGLRLAALGLAVGLAVSLGATRLLVRLLYGVSPTDVMTLILVPVILITATLAASYIPARRATLVDPMLALRCE